MKFSTEKKKCVTWSEVGCQKLTYHKTFSPLKVVYNDLNIKSNTSLGTYRYGFQGQEKDDEVKGEGNSINYKFRMHDPRIGRFFAVDPLAPKYPQWGQYNFSGNQVIATSELEGLEPKQRFDKSDAQRFKEEIKKAFPDIGVEAKKEAGIYPALTANAKLSGSRESAGYEQVKEP